MMHLARKIEQAGATGYILLWLLGIPIPILILIFLLRLHINIADKIQSLRQCSGSRSSVWLHMLRRCIPDREALGSAGSINSPCGGLVR
jgi:hypothetical protein